MFDRNRPLPIVEKHILNNFGSLGDSVCALPALKWLEARAEERRHTFRFFTRFKELFDNFFDNSPYVKIQTWDASYASTCYNGSTQNWHGLLTRLERPTTFHNHVVDYIGMILSDCRLEGDERNYPTFDASKVDVSRFGINFENCIAISGCHAFDIRSMRYGELKKLVDWIDKETPYTPIVLGKTGHISGQIYAKKHQGDLAPAIDLVNQTNIAETAAILSKVKCFAGVDGGLAHVAGLTDIPIVCSYNTVRPEDRMPIRRGLLGWNVYPITSNLSCSPCQYKLAYHHYGFDRCAYGDLACLPKADAFIEKLARLL